MKVSDRIILFIEDDIALAEELITYFEENKAIDQRRGL